MKNPPQTILENREFFIKFGIQYLLYAIYLLMKQLKFYMRLNANFEHHFCQLKNKNLENKATNSRPGKREFALIFTLPCTNAKSCNFVPLKYLNYMRESETYFR